MAKYQGSARLIHTTILSNALEMKSIWANWVREVCHFLNGVSLWKNCLDCTFGDFLSIITTSFNENVSAKIAKVKGNYLGYSLKKPK